MTSPGIAGPHQAITASDQRERFALELFDILWDRYRRRVKYVADYEQVIHEAGATFVNDHIAFRTFACQQPTTGIVSLSRIFEGLGYHAASYYHFADKHLDAIYYQHPNGQFPKLFISQVRTWELSSSSQAIIQRVLASHRPPLSAETLSSLMRLSEGDQTEIATLQRTVVEQFHQLPWEIPNQDQVHQLNDRSQYAAWVLVHGYNVNHFTSLVNSHGVKSLDDIDKTAKVLRDAGVPMKDRVEGESGSKLRQTATQAVVIDVPVDVGGKPGTIPWTYAYFELAERGDVIDPETNQPNRFEGFLGPQATQLFEMTRPG